MILIAFRGRHFQDRLLYPFLLISFLDRITLHVEECLVPMQAFCVPGYHPCRVVVNDKLDHHTYPTVVNVVTTLYMWLTA